jgi:protein phosphatase 2C family protein 2/3
MDTCLSPTSYGGEYGRDNMTVIIVALLHGKTKEEWYDMIVDRVKKRMNLKRPCDHHPHDVVNKKITAFE